jgi:gluconate 2-dehydrogenase gamma chain
MDKQPPGRRAFLKKMSALGVAGVPAAMAVNEAAAQHAHHVAQTAAPATAQTLLQTRRFLTPAEFDFIEAAAARLIPADELGPGAKEAGAAWFIDGQLDSSWGTHGRNYRQGPWPDTAIPQQGYQLPHTPQEVYRRGINDTNAYCEQRFGKSFDKLTGAEQDGVLRDLEAGKIELPGVPARAFFAMMHTNTIESFFADPMYGGNRDKAGWKLVGFPGVAAVYTPHIGKYNQPYRVEPVSIADYEGGRVAIDEHGHPQHVMLSAIDQEKNHGDH